MLNFVAFGLFGIIAMAAAMMVIAAKEIMHSVFYLAVFFISIAAIYLLLETEFLSIIQVLVYVGGVVVMLIFAVMLIKRGGKNE